MDELAFLGYGRTNGRAGTRNDALVLSINGLVAQAAKRIAEAVMGAKFVATPYGRCQFGVDRKVHTALLTGIGAHPNTGALLIVGADRKSADEIALAVTTISAIPVEVLTLDDVGEDALELTARGIRICAHLVRHTSLHRREPLPVSQLYLGVECGHSDATSGLTANPIAGAIVDRLIDAGGTAVVGETIEWLGAEHSLGRRVAEPTLGKAIEQAVKEREDAVIAVGEDLLGNNPSPENIRGGLTTIEEKSLGAIAKSGSRTIQGLLPFAGRPDACGLYLMNGPSFSPESLTGFVASGVQISLFTTGPGNSFSSLLAPTVKMTANPETVGRLSEQIDFDASNVFTARETVEEAADRLFSELLEIASGRLTWAEILGEGAEVFARMGASL